MGKNPLYANEIATANQFVIDHNNDMNFINLLSQLKSHEYSHSDRWSIIYDYLADNYPEATGTIVTGLSYWVED